MRTHLLVAALIATALPIVGCASLSADQAAVAAPQVIGSLRVEPGGLYEIIHNSTDGQFYIAAVGPRGENKARISRVHAGTLAADEGIDVSTAALYGLGFNSRTQTLYGTATVAGSVSAINVRTGAVTTIQREGEKPHLREIIVDEAANKAYASIVGYERDGQTVASQIWVINGANNTVEKVIAVDTKGLTGIALDAANNRIFGTGMSSNEVVAVDLASGAVTARWQTQSERPTNLIYDAAGHRIFVVSQGGGDLTVLDTRNGALLGKVATGAGALSVAYNSALKQAYVANRQAGTVTVVNTEDYTIVANLDAGTFPQSIAIDRRTNLVYVTNKARGVPRGSPPGTPAPEDPKGDTLTVIKPR